MKILQLLLGGIYAVFISPEHVKLVQNFFGALNPYKHDVDMFKIEDYEDKNKIKHLADDVWFYEISAKDIIYIQ